MKKATIRWYTPEGKYMGWTYQSKVTYRSARSWLRSGNYIRIKSAVLNPFTSETKLLNLFPR